jgi:hypothetical protein
MTDLTSKDENEITQIIHLIENSENEEEIENKKSERKFQNDETILR